MSESKKPTKRQSAVIEDLFASELDEPEILKKHHIRPGEYERWLADEDFAGALERRIAHAHRQSRIVLARNAVKAANTLVLLTGCEKEEVARKACLDIIALHACETAGPSTAGEADRDSTSPVRTGRHLSPELASRLLAALAEEQPGKQGD